MNKRINLTLNEEYQGYVESLSKETGITDYPVLIRLAIKRSSSLITFGAVPKALPVSPKVTPKAPEAPRPTVNRPKDITPVEKKGGYSDAMLAIINKADSK